MAAQADVHDAAQHAIGKAFRGSLAGHALPCRRIEACALPGDVGELALLTALSSFWQTFGDGAHRSAEQDVGAVGCGLAADRAIGGTLDAELAGHGAETGAQPRCTRCWGRHSSARARHLPALVQPCGGIRPSSAEAAPGTWTYTCA